MMNTKIALPELPISPEPPPLRRDEHGMVRVGWTRIPLDTVVYAFIDGATPEGIVERFDTLDVADVYAVIAYYLRHKNEVDAYLEAREGFAAALRAEIEARFPQHGLRERLLARRAAQEHVANAAADRG